MHSPEKDPSLNFAIEAARKREQQVAASIAMAEQLFGHIIPPVVTTPEVQPTIAPVVPDILEADEIANARSYIDALYESSHA